MTQHSPDMGWLDDWGESVGTASIAGEIEMARIKNQRGRTTKEKCLHFTILYSLMSILSDVERRNVDFFD